MFELHEIRAGAHFEWLLQDDYPGDMDTDALRQTFSGILPEVEPEARELLTIID